MAFKILTLCRVFKYFIQILPFGDLIFKLVGSVALLVARWTNDRKVERSRPTKVVCINHSVDR